ncbi:MAG: hypothetical protein AB2421_20065, partial [Thermotaleaceae bacterium]
SNILKLSRINMPFIERSETIDQYLYPISAEYVMYATPNEAAIQLFSEEVFAKELSYPEGKIREKLSFRDLR